MPEQDAMREIQETICFDHGTAKPIKACDACQRRFDPEYVSKHHQEQIDQLAGKAETLVGK